MYRPLVALFAVGGRADSQVACGCTWQRPPSQNWGKDTKNFVDSVFLAPYPFPKPPPPPLSRSIWLCAACVTNYGLCGEASGAGRVDRREPGTAVATGQKRATARNCQPAGQGSLSARPRQGPPPSLAGPQPTPLRVVLCPFLRTCACWGMEVWRPRQATKLGSHCHALFLGGGRPGRPAVAGRGQRT